MQITSLPAVQGFSTTGQIRVVLYQSGQLVHAPVGGIGLALTADLATVATSGAYSDLSGLPTLGALAAKDKASLASDVSGILPIANGGTGASTATAALTALGIPYQTGSFAPGVAFGGASTGIAYGAQTQGSYVRFANLAYMTGWIALTSKGSATGNASITGLPFSRNNSDYAATSFGRVSNMTGLTGAIAGYSVANTITLTLNISTGYGGNVTDANFTNTTQLFFSHLMSI